MSEPNYRTINEDAAKRFLAEMALRKPGVESSPEAAAAVSLARAMDFPDSTTSLANCSEKYLATLAAIRSLVPREETSDAVDELRRRRQKRRAS